MSSQLRVFGELLDLFVGALSNVIDNGFVFCGVLVCAFAVATVVRLVYIFVKG